MKTIEIGASHIKASQIGFGCMRIAGLDTTAINRMVQNALDLGMNFFDHADIYADGRCEELFASAVGMRPAIRERMILQSKCGIRKGFFDFSKEYILQSVDNILQRLQTDYLDIFLLHRPDALMEPQEVAEALDKLHKEGKVRHFGVSNENPMEMELLAQYLKSPIVADQVQFSVAHTGMIDAGLNANMKNPVSVMHDGGILAYCRMKGITPQAWGPLSYGYFEGTFLNNEKFAELNTVLGRIAQERNASKAAVSIAWILRHPAKIQPMIGFMEEGQIADIAKAAQIELSREEWYEIYRAAGNTLP